MGTGFGVGNETVAADLLLTYEAETWMALLLL